MSHLKFKNEYKQPEGGRLTTVVTPVGLFYLIKYLYEEKVGYPELEEQF